MVTIPVSLYAGAEESAFEREEYSPDGRKVGRTFTVKVDEGIQKDVDNTIKVALDAALKDGRITEVQYERASKFSHVEKIGYGEIVKCVNTASGLVAVPDADLVFEFDGFDSDEDRAKLARILEFVPLHFLGTGSYVPESIMQARPKREKGKVNSGYERAFATLLKGMRNRAVFALVQFVDHNKLKYGALMSTGRMWVLKYDEEVREDLPLPDMDNLDPDQVRMMGTLIDTVTVTEPRLLEDAATTLAWEYVESKITDGELFKPADVSAAPANAAGDLMESLKASVEAVKNNG